AFRSQRQNDEAGRPTGAPRPGGPSGSRRAGAAVLDAVLTVEALDPTGRVDQLLLAGEERMAGRADLDVDGRDRRGGLDGIAAGTDDARLLVPRMDAFLHGRSVYNTGFGEVQRSAGSP